MEDFSLEDLTNSLLILEQKDRSWTALHSFSQGCQVDNRLECGTWRTKSLQQIINLSSVAMFTHTVTIIRQHWPSTTIKYCSKGIQSLTISVKYKSTEHSHNVRFFQHFCIVRVTLHSNLHCRHICLPMTLLQSSSLSNNKSTSYCITLRRLNFICSKATVITVIIRNGVGIEGTDACRLTIDSMHLSSTIEVAIIVISASNQNSNCTTHRVDCYHRTLYSVNTTTITKRPGWLCNVTGQQPEVTSKWLITKAERNMNKHW